MREIHDQNVYRDKLLKLMPSEIVTAYIVIDGVIPANAKLIGTIVVSLVLLGLTPVYLLKVSKVNNVGQIVVSTLSFLVWVYTLGGPFAALGIHETWIASAILTLWTLIVPLLVPPKTGP
jgi:hypothetical protein